MKSVQTTAEVCADLGEVCTDHAEVLTLGNVHDILISPKSKPLHLKLETITYSYLNITGRTGERTQFVVTTNPIRFI